MRIYFAAAGALLLSTSAFALAPSGAKEGKIYAPVPVSKESAVDYKASKQLKAAVLDELAEAGLKPQQAAFSSFDDAKTKPEFASAETDPVKPVSVAAVTWDDDKTKIEAEPIATGVGGPDEGIEKSTVSLDLTPRIASHDYPACYPGPGDDNCIQLYEPGVRTALASWNGETGGLLDPSAGTAMGGPLEEVDDTGVKTATADASIGTGGPVRETGYPPCSGSESDDRCIQLYEPGVTGAGN